MAFGRLLPSILLAFFFIASPVNAEDCLTSVLQSAIQVEIPMVKGKMDSSHFEYFDRNNLVDGTLKNGAWHFKAEVNSSGLLKLDVSSVTTSGERSKLIHAKKMFDEMMEYFKSNQVEIKSIAGDWRYGSNLAELNRATSLGSPIKSAALGTWTAQQASRFGYTEVQVLDKIGSPGKYVMVEVLFTKPY